ncbi:MAG: hypothetical protein OXG72_20565, partial [Acidobacteria bacterium]|nr:hypothetical protein [Acidobacteriota bacterium]
PPLPVTRLPLRIRQRHDHSTPLRNGPVTGARPPTFATSSVGGLGANSGPGAQPRGAGAGGGFQRYRSVR